MNVSHINGMLVIRPRDASGVADHDIEPITDREREVLALVADGLSNKEISEKLFISERKVKNHLTSTMAKLRASDRTRAVVKAIRMGWLQI
ncbi:MAG: response regulator transcription factor [SAR202 cluster bacterium]|nr:response regulator transcription factor [SAR202 cluster bacterium]